MDESGEASGKLRDEGEAKGEGGKGGKRTGGRSPSWATDDAVPR